MKPHFAYLLLLLVLQQQPRTHIVDIYPRQPQLQSKLDKQIAGLKDAAAVWKVVYPQVAKLNVTVTIDIIKEPHQHLLMAFNPVKAPAATYDKMVFESKGTANQQIDAPAGFRRLPATMALLDTLRLTVLFDNGDFPISDYYVRWQMPFKEQRLLPKERRQLLLANQPGRYHSFELRNTATDSRVLLGGRLYLLTSSEKMQLKNLVEEFRLQAPDASLLNVTQLVNQYLAARFGQPIDQQVYDWLKENFEELN
ncbi:hypothetical protein EOD41_04165 [Mucilaginibacter limnophilus]|uniref:Uncharacterized protein n=1 Tax=Mucilaginibacter limnophilus TaxID=1932778 RepID=A0A437MZP0_9SPHI|nr:hypothetical protein [Mucilaginibacter limnophilus]RVU03133.1 hypothetical protein EOD41_04165 [Mucilaginibacter limnophilus]